MSILRKKPILSRLLSGHASQGESNSEDTITPPSIIINDTVSVKKT